METSDLRDWVLVVTALLASIAGLYIWLRREPNR